MSEEHNQRPVPAPQPADIARWRAARLRQINAAVVTISALLLANLALPWWKFATPGGQTLVVGGTRTQLVPATGYLIGRQAGGVPVTAALVACGLLAAAASARRWWPVAVATLLVAIPAMLYGVRGTPPGMVTQATSTGAAWTSPAVGITALTMLGVAQIALLVLCGAQTFTVKRAEAVAAGETGLGEKARGLIDTYVTSLIGRFKVEETKPGTT